MPADNARDSKFVAGPPTAAGPPVFARGPIFATSSSPTDQPHAAEDAGALLEAMAGAPGHRRGPATPATEFFVLATENPIEMEGVYRCRSWLDRFLVKLIVECRTSDARGSAPRGGPARQTDLHAGAAVFLQSVAHHPRRATRPSNTREARPRDAPSPRAALAAPHCDTGAHGVRSCACARHQPRPRSPSTTSRSPRPTVLRHRIGLRFRSGGGGLTAGLIAHQILQATAVTGDGHERRVAPFSRDDRPARAPPRSWRAKLAGKHATRPDAVARASVGSGIGPSDLPRLLARRRHAPSWHAYARLEPPHPSRRGRGSLRLTLVVDPSASMGWRRPTKLLTRHVIAAELRGGGARRRRSRRGRRRSPVNGRAGLPRVLASSMARAQRVRRTCRRRSRSWDSLRAATSASS